MGLSTNLMSLFLLYIWALLRFTLPPFIVRTSTIASLHQAWQSSSFISTFVHGLKVSVVCSLTHEACNWALPTCITTGSALRRQGSLCHWESGKKSGPWTHSIGDWSKIYDTNKLHCLLTSIYLLTIKCFPLNHAIPQPIISDLELTVAAGTFASDSSLVSSACKLDCPFEFETSDALRVFCRFPIEQTQLGTKGLLPTSHLPSQPSPSHNLEAGAQSLSLHKTPVELDCVTGKASILCQTSLHLV